MENSEAQFENIAKWYEMHCDGKWEHENGVSIVTMDNPGWSVRIDLRGTSLQRRPMAPYRSDNFEEDNTDWVECKLSPDANQFWGVGDPSKLVFILDYFLSFARGGRNANEDI